MEHNSILLLPPNISTPHKRLESLKRNLVLDLTLQIGKWRRWR